MKKRTLLNTLPFHMMLLAPVVLVFIFHYIPMFGVVISFQDYKPGWGFLGSPWVGFENYKMLAMMPDTLKAVRNTVFIAFMKIIGNLVVPVAFALLLNEIRQKWFKKTAQTITYLPYFLSWVILAGIVTDFLSLNGFVNMIIKAFGGKSIFFLGNKQWFPYVMVITDVWKGFGFNTIVYLAALTGIDETLYEASSIDGAGRWKQTWHITLPGISQFVVLMTILSIGNILNAGFDQIFNLYNPMVYETGDIIDTLVYRMGIVNQSYSLSTAVGLFKSVISLILISTSHKMAGKYANYKVF